MSAATLDGDSRNLCLFQVMTEKEKEIIRDLSKCGFKEIDAHFKLMSEQRKARSKEERKAEHPKQGMLKRRVMPEDVIINCSKDSNIPQPPDGHR